MVGLLGLIPIYLGIRFAIVGEGEEEEEEEEEIIERLEQSKADQLFLDSYIADNCVWRR